jgi:lipase maturation factor 1
MQVAPGPVIKWLFASPTGGQSRLIPRWLFLRALGAIYFSAFFSLVFQIRGLIGPHGILPAGTYLEAVAQSLGHWERFWYAPTLLWWTSGATMLIVMCWVGMAASLLVLVNVWPRMTLAVCFVCFLSFVSAAQDFSGYQSDGMLLEAGFIALFFAPSGLRPGLARAHLASRASLFLLQWEWFRIYFESGVVKLLSGDVQWRNFTAMDDYYQNGPLPTWIGWYVGHLSHAFHAATVYATLALELGIVWALFLPRRWRVLCFLIVTPWEIGVILTANYTFLNYLVLVLGLLLLDDKFVIGLIPGKWRTRLNLSKQELAADCSLETQNDSTRQLSQDGIRRYLHPLKLAMSAVMLTWIFYATTAELIWMFGSVPLPTSPVSALEPFRIANRYGLFAVMTRGRYEIEFQGSQDGENWISYPFRFKPQKLNRPPGIYAPYQPRFDWNLWFASLGAWRDYPIVPNTEVELLTNNHDVLQLFAGNPFAAQPPRQVRALLWQYWFTSLEEKRKTGMWWRRKLLGLYAPTLQRAADGKISVVEWPNAEPRE